MLTWHRRRGPLPWQSQMRQPLPPVAATDSRLGGDGGGGGGSMLSDFAAAAATAAAAADDDGGIGNNGCELRTRFSSDFCASYFTAEQER